MSNTGIPTKTSATCRKCDCAVELWEQDGLLCVTPCTCTVGHDVVSYLALDMVEVRRYFFGHNVATGIIPDGHGYPYAARCTCGWSVSYCKPETAQDAAEAHAAQLEALASRSDILR